jgi:hypothetical protein
MIELTDEQASVLKQGSPIRVFVPELGADVVVVLAASKESIESVRRSNLRVLRKIANQHIAERYPTTVAAGLEPRLEARGNAEVWILPLVYASTGYGDQGIVGDVGSITIDPRTGSVLEATARDEVVALVRKLHEENREAIEAAFSSAAAK